jgi:hypothetical protein
MSFILKNYLLNFSKFINILIQTSKLVYSKNMKELIMNKNYFEIIKIVCESGRLYFIIIKSSDPIA